MTARGGEEDERARLSVLQVSTMERRGGAARVAHNLHLRFRRRGHRSWLLVGARDTDDPDVLLLEPGGGPWAGWWSERRVPAFVRRAVGRAGAAQIASAVGRPRRALEVLLGLEDFDYPATWRLLEAPPHTPDVLHAHNLHGGYFDLRALPLLSSRVPTFLTLHDAWLLSGHCAHSFDCERWKTGCGSCPDLTIYPAVRRDATAYNWRRKKRIYEASRLYVATPSAWLMRKVEQSILAPGIVEARVIPNGADLEAFAPGDPASARSALGIPRDARVLACTGENVRSVMWKDPGTLLGAVKAVAGGRQGEDVLLLAAGQGPDDDLVEGVRVRFVDAREPAEMAHVYRAADIFLHVARVDTFPNTIIESMACGVPVVATATGGVVEQVVSAWPGRAGSGMGGEGEPTGILVPQGDGAALERAINDLLEDEPLRRRLGRAGEADARRFDLDRQSDAYLDWYAEVLTSRAPVPDRAG